VEPLEGRLAPAVFAVTSLRDSNDPGSGSLRRAITESNGTAGPNEIDIRTPGTYKLTLSGTATDNSAGELSILNNSVDIENQSGGAVVIDATGLNTRVLDVSPSGSAVNVTITGVTIQAGNTTDNGGGIQVQNASTLTLNNDIVQNNSAGQRGGGIWSNGPVTLNATTIRDNKALASSGGGVREVGAPIIVQNHSVITGNTAGLNGGGLRSEGPITLTDSSVTMNQSGESGGGIYGNGNITVTNSTVSGNATTGQSFATWGGGITQDGNGHLTLMNSLITNNSSGNPIPGSGGGGVYISPGSNATIQGSVISSNASATSGGGLFLDNCLSVTIIDSEIDSNGAAFGGGLYSQGSTSAQQLTISSSTFFDNMVTLNGAGLYLLSTATSGQNTPSASLTNVTITGNSAAEGGGLVAQGIYPATLLNDTIAFNSASNAGGGVIALGPFLTFTNTIVAANSAGPGGHPDVDNSGAAVYMADGGNNFIGDNTGAADSFQANTPNATGSYVGTGTARLDPRLGGATDNGGAAAVFNGSHPLTLEDQPNSGNNGVQGRGNAAAAPGTDERGFPRLLVGAQSDIGAFQFQDADLAVSISAPPGALHAGRPETFTITVHNLGPNTARSVTLTDTLPAGTTLVRASGSPTVQGNVLTFAGLDLPAGGSASFTLTVLPSAPGPFTVKAEVSTHDDPNPANNTAALTLTVLPRPFPATGSADVTGLVQLMPLGRRRRAQRQLAFLITNVSGTPIQGPLEVVVPGLRPRRGPKLLNAGGVTAGRQKFVRVDVGGNSILDPGQSAVVVLVFSQPFTLPGLDVLAGALA
jgi:uncharacterized repeat protein (TIGR01451 family)